MAWPILFPILQLNHDSNLCSWSLRFPISTFHTSQLSPSKPTSTMHNCICSALSPEQRHQLHQAQREGRTQVPDCPVHPSTMSIDHDGPPRGTPMRVHLPHLAQEIRQQLHDERTGQITEGMYQVVFVPASRPSTSGWHGLGVCGRWVPLPTTQGPYPPTSSGRHVPRPTTRGPSPSSGRLPEPTTGGLPQPTTRVESQPTTRAAPLPTTRAAPHPPTRGEPRSTTRVIPHPTTRAAPLPTTRAAPLPTTRAAPLPTTRAAPHPPTRGEPRSTTRMIPHPTTREAPLPTTRRAPSPTTRAIPQPTTRVPAPTTRVPPPTTPIPNTPRPNTHPQQSTSALRMSGMRPGSRHVDFDFDPSLGEPRNRPPVQQTAPPNPSRGSNLAAQKAWDRGERPPTTSDRHVAKARKTPPPPPSPRGQGSRAPKGILKKTEVPAATIMEGASAHAQSARAPTAATGGEAEERGKRDGPPKGTLKKRETSASTTPTAPAAPRIPEERPRQAEEVLLEWDEREESARDGCFVQ